MKFPTLGFKDGVFAVVIFLLASALIFKSCKTTPLPKPTTIIKIDTFYTKKDTVKVESIIPVYKTIPGKSSVDTVHDTIPIPVLKQDFYATRVYKDSLYYDSSYVKVYDTLSQNKLIGRGYAFHLSYPTIVKTITTTLPQRAEWFYAFGVAGNKIYPFYGVDANIMLKARNGNLFSVGIGTDINKQMNFSLRFGKKF